MINGTVLADGRVFFVNPAGVLIGGSARINVNQLVASSLNISDSSFLSGQYEFTGGDGQVVNNGEISAQSVYLVGKEVINTGIIECPAGYVVMAAGDRVFLRQLGSNLIVEVDRLETSEASENPSSKITNEGEIIAAGGIGRLEDLLELQKIGVEGVVIGKALYEERFTLKEALERLGGT